MKILKVLFIGTLLVFAGCSSKYGLNEGASSISDEALEANNLTGAPSWVLNGGSDGLSAIGSANITKAGLQFARTEALAVARDELSRMIAVKVKGVVSNAIEQSIGNNAYDSVVEKYGQQITEQTTNQMLTGSKQKDTWITGDGAQIYVLIGLDQDLAEKARKNVLQNIANESAPVQKDKFLDALNRALGEEIM